jgi:hypothetical protein
MSTYLNDSIGIWGARGGVGCTTTAILLMKSLLKHNPNSRVILSDFANNQGFAPMTGQVGQTCSFESHESKARGIVQECITVADCGVYDETKSNPAVLTNNYLVVRGPDYVGLRTICAYNTPAKEVFDGIIVVLEPGRSLDCDDVRNITDMPVTTIRHDAAIARACDAGVLTVRPNLDISLIDLSYVKESK